MQWTRTNVIKYVAIFIAFLILSFCYSQIIHYKFKTNYVTDFAVFHHGAQAYLHDRSIYSKIDVKAFSFPQNLHLDAQHSKEASKLLACLRHQHCERKSNNLNPPFFTALILPLGMMSYKHALLCWLLIGFLVATIGVILFVSEAPYQNKTVFFYLSMILAFFASFPSLINLQYAQIGNFVFLFVIAGWILERRGHLVWAGIVLGFIASIKLFAGMFLIYYLLQKKWRAAIAYIITGVVTSLIGLWIFGLKAYQAYLKVFSNIHWYGFSWNDSLKGFLTRFLKNDANAMHIDKTINILYYALALLVIIIYLLIFKYKHKEKAWLDYNFSLTIIVMFLISPLGWGYYFMLLIIPLFLVYRYMASQEKPTALLFFWGLAFFFTNIITTILRSTSTYHDLQDTIYYSFGFFSLVIFLGICIYLRFALMKVKDLNLPANNKHYFTGLYYPFIVLIYFPVVSVFIRWSLSA